MPTPIDERLGPSRSLIRGARSPSSRPSTARDHTYSSRAKAGLTLPPPSSSRRGTARRSRPDTRAESRLGSSARRPQTSPGKRAAPAAHASPSLNPSSSPKAASKLDADAAYEIALANKAVKENAVTQLSKIANRLADRCMTKYRSVPDLFRRMDVDGDGSIDIDEFERGLIKCGFRINRRDVEEIYKMLDRDSSRDINYVEFCEMLEPKRNQYSTGRLHLHATVRGDSTISDFKIDPEAARLKPVSGIEADYLRDLVQKKITVKSKGGAVVPELLRAFQFVDPRKDGYITYDEFRDAIGMGGKGVPGLNIGLTEEQVEKLISICDVDRDGCIALKEFVREITKTSYDNEDIMTRSRNGYVDRMVGRSKNPPLEETLTAIALQNSLRKAKGDAGNVPSMADATSEQVVERTLEMLRTRNRARGGLRKAFRTYDLDKSGTVEKHEFKDLIKRLNCQLTPNEFEMLWDKFDRDGDGCVYADEFCDAVFRDEQSAATPFANPASAKSNSALKFTMAARRKEMASREQEQQIGQRAKGGDGDAVAEPPAVGGKNGPTEGNGRLGSARSQGSMQSTRSSMSASEASAYSSSLARAKSASHLHGQSSPGFRWSRRLNFQLKGAATFTRGRPETSSPKRRSFNARLSPLQNSPRKGGGIRSGSHSRRRRRDRSRRLSLEHDALQQEESLGELEDIPISGASSHESIRLRRKRKQKLSDLFLSGKRDSKTQQRVDHTDMILMQVCQKSSHVPTRTENTPDRGLHLTQGHTNPAANAPHSVQSIQARHERFLTTSSVGPDGLQRTARSRRSRAKHKYVNGRHMQDRMHEHWRLARDLGDIQARNNVRSGARSQLKYMQSMMKKENEAPGRRPGKYLLDKSIFPGEQRKHNPPPHPW